MIKKCHIAAALLICISGCGPPKDAAVVHNRSELSSIESAKSETLKNIKTGMSFDEFHQLVPEAYLTAEHNGMKAYELVYEQKYVSHGEMAMQNLGTLGLQRPSAKKYKQALWFYFFQDHLVKRGYPETWPADPNIIDNSEAATSSEK